MKQHIATKVPFGAAMMELCSPQIWCSLVHLALISRVWKYTPIEKLVTLSITQLGIVRYRSNFVQSLTIWYSDYCKCSRSRGQRSRLQCGITGGGAKSLKIINNSAGDCSILSNLLQTL